MGLFNKIFGDSEDKGTTDKLINWDLLTQIDQLQAIKEESTSTPVLIFKHSTRCSISRMALKQFENHYTVPQSELRPYFLDLLEYRPISNAIADEFQVVHQSPQILLIVDGKCVYTASHGEIDAEDVMKKIKEISST